jgi:TPR repeat protein
LAINWYRKAAEQGNVDAEFSMALLYSIGSDALNPKSEEAVKWYRKAAYRGSPEAEYCLGRAYAEGIGGLVQDDIEAVKWYEKAAQHGHSEAQAALSGAYFQGKGISKDVVMAYVWANVSAGHNNQTALYMRNLIEKQLTAEQVAEGQRLSRLETKQ